MANRTRIVCLHEGKRGSSIDPLFIRVLIRKLDPAWLRPWEGNNVIRPYACGGRKELIAATPVHLKQCLAMGSDITLMVWADVDHDHADCDQLKATFWAAAQEQGISAEQFDQVVFAFARDRLENWIEFLLTGRTDENVEGPRVKHDGPVAEAARELARQCESGAPIAAIPASLEWSCRNWRALRARMRA